MDFDDCLRFAGGSCVCEPQATAMDILFYAILFLPAPPAIWSWWRWAKVRRTFGSELPANRKFSSFALAAVTGGLAIYTFWIIFAYFAAANEFKVSIAHFCFRASPLLCLGGIILAVFGDKRLRASIIVSALAVELTWFLIEAATL
jgi:hypothetical protein